MQSDCDAIVSSRCAVICRAFGFVAERSPWQSSPFELLPQECSAPYFMQWYFGRPPVESAKICWSLGREKAGKRLPRFLFAKHFPSLYRTGAGCVFGFFSHALSDFSEFTGSLPDCFRTATGHGPSLDRIQHDTWDGPFSCVNHWTTGDRFMDKFIRRHPRLVCGGTGDRAET